MKIKRFFAPDMRQAIRLVREEQGPDAVILSSRRVDGGIEIVSAIDFDQDLISDMVGQAPATTPAEPEAPRQTSFQESYEAVANTQVAAPKPEPAAAPDVVWSQDPAIVEMRRELESMRGLLQDQLSQLAWGEFSRRQPLHAQIVRRLIRLGLSPKLAKTIAGGLRNSKDPERAWREALAVFAKRIPVNDEDIINHGGVIALVGPTGVGKTTTIAKLAARFALRHGRQHVALVTADAYRIGAQQQLLTFGQILGVQTHAVANREELGRTLQSLMGKKLVLIDTAGTSQRDMRLTEQFNALGSMPLIKTFLVVAANAQRTVLEEVLRAFGRAQLDGCILTKVDEAATLGDALSAVIRSGLPLHYVCDGQRVPEDLHLARTTQLVSRAVALAQGHEKAEAELEARQSPASTFQVKGVGANAHV